MGLIAVGVTSSQKKVVGVTDIIWAIWKCRNNACFHNIYLYDPTSVIAQTAHWLEFFSGIQRRGVSKRHAKGE